MRTRALLAGGAAAGPVFVGTYSVLGRLARGYDRRRDAVSDLARTEVGWAQTANFLVSGGLTLAGAVGLRRSLPDDPGTRSLPILVGAVGSGLIGAGLFATDTAEETASRGLSRRGKLHVASAVPFFVGLPAACLVAGWHRDTRSMDASSVAAIDAGVVAIVAAALAGAGFSRTGGRLYRWAGFFQRVAVVSGFAWLTAFSLSDRSRTAGAIGEAPVP